MSDIDKKDFHDIKVMSKEEFLKYLADLLSSATDDKQRSFVKTAIWHLDKLDTWIEYNRAITPAIYAIEQAGNTKELHSINWGALSLMVSGATRLANKTNCDDLCDYMDYLGLFYNNYLQKGEKQ